MVSFRSPYNRVSVSELSSVFKALSFDAGTSSADLTDAVTGIDKDGNGSIDLHEFADFHRANASTNGAGKNNEIGDTFDMGYLYQCVLGIETMGLQSVKGDDSVNVVWTRLRAVRMVDAASNNPDVL
ncbi:hypothetical protein RHSIM_Rhsim10G0052300 [Rhododendron simsii]|uniref:EF-hand domain-containing protein n=1 Tax=Rhododendron simsii TaxID=118357 RepID=A0A834GAG4_RHOSS|nr:hypothetical protein RHSIM_Rhsim10G0052300 [Rhododendron simsii]